MPDSGGGVGGVRSLDAPDGSGLQKERAAPWAAGRSPTEAARRRTGRDNMMLPSVFRQRN